MLKARVIPCLDVKDGRVVKGVNFVNLRDAGDPVEAAIAYDAAGADELCFLDITASHENRDTIFDVVRRTAEACFMPLTVGGRGDDVVHDAAAVARSGDVEEDEFVGALRVVGFRRLDGIAGVAELLKFHALDHAAGVDVQAGNYSSREHGDDVGGELASPRCATSAQPTTRERAQVSVCVTSGSKFTARR